VSKGSDQPQRTAAVLELLDRSWVAHRTGNRTEAERLIMEAVELDVVCVSAVRGGILIGEIPNPETDYPAWADYVVTAREKADDHTHV
jgi:hypothetical protein